MSNIIQENLLWYSFEFCSPGFNLSWFKEGGQVLGSLTSGGFWCQIPWRQLSLEGFILRRALGCELRGKTNRPLAGKREAEVTEPERQEDYSILCKGTKGRGFPKRWRPAPFSSERLCGMVKPEKGARVVHTEELDPSRGGSPPDSHPQKCRKVSWWQRTMVVWTVVMVTGVDGRLLWMLSLPEDLDVILREGTKHQDGTLTFPPTTQVGLEAGSASFRDNKMGVSCTVKFEKNKNLYALYIKRLSEFGKR